MGNIKNFKLFEQSYSDNLDEVLENDENNFIILKGDEVIAGYEYLEDCFTELSDILEVDGAISDEQRYEFDDYVSMSNVQDYEEQYEIDEFVSELLDKFEVVEPYKIYRREELEETEGDDIEFEDDYEDMLGESVNHNNEEFSIVGDLNDRTEELDSFDSREEAEDFLEDYKLVYSEYNNLRVVPKGVNEDFDTHEQERNLANQDLDDDLAEWENLNLGKCDCCVDGECTCVDYCDCGDECDCDECGDNFIEESTRIKTFMNFRK